ncbi:hypothetical protein [Cellulosilyticum sp. WCF-2]|uniref:hypothetical protein n=1 Tax=Cellulosilyticum sp. WCF-2 TaxID=2497860 RepID=UPI000F8F24B6|nr:hypothetical protein [Cellulosilyticum sp. WCF-2]QEH68615.1 hypothetical protein EKH84_09620 [Cellulosilyticum sp. WCF-2]
MINYKILDMQITPNDDVLDDLKQIKNNEHIQTELRRGGLIALMIDCYHYGVMKGKQEERSKRAKNKAFK